MTASSVNSRNAGVVAGAAAAGRRDAAQPTTRFRRRAGAGAMLLAPWGITGSVLAYSIATRHGGDDYTGAHALVLAKAHATELRIAMLAAMLGCLLLVPALLTAMRLLRPHAPKLSLVAGISMIAGYVCYFGVVLGSTGTLAMAERGGPVKDYAAVLDAAQSDGWFMWVFLLFVFGNLIGTTLLAIAVFRSRPILPVWAGIGLLGWPILHVTGLIAGSEWFEVVGSLLQVAGFTAMALVVLRTRDEDWDPAPVAA